MDLKKALLISLVGHCFILTPVGNFGLFLRDKKNNDIQITYYSIKPIKAELQKPKEIDTKKISEVIKAAEVIKKEGGISKRPRPKRVKKATPTDIRPQEKSTLEKENIIPSSIPGTTLPNTPQCLGYYHYIREEIRRFLENSYTTEYEEGEVGINFMLNQIGELVNFNIVEEKSVNDPFLKRLAYESVRKASPFKPFPKGLNLKQISFNLTVVFKK